MNVILTHPSGSDLAASTDAARSRVRQAAMYLSIAIAALYGLIATRVVTVIAGPAQQVARDQLAFALPAAGAFALGAEMLWRFDHRVLWVGGAVLQVLIIAMYFSVAPRRGPDFEFWDVTIRVLQLVLLAALTYLAIRSRGQPEPTSAILDG